MFVASPLTDGDMNDFKELITEHGHEYKIRWMILSNFACTCHIKACLVCDELQTDKASMLDEIIDYVKFLQLQVKANSPFSSRHKLIFL